jgi:ZIP family zinc transporter
MLKRSYFAASLAFAAGAMLFVSFVELLPHGIGVHDGHSSSTMEWIVYGAFFVGIVIVALIDHFLPASFNPSEVEGKEGQLDRTAKRSNTRLFRSGVLVALVLGLHNFPEGMSTFLAANQDLSVGIALAVAIAIHNIPEGIAVAAPIYAATKNRKKAFWWATASGFAELAGGLLGALLVGVLLPSTLTGVVFGLVAGMMVFVAIDELLPAARRYQTDMHQVVYGLVAGMVVMAVSLLLL